MMGFIVIAAGVCFILAMSFDLRFEKGTDRVLYRIIQLGIAIGLLAAIIIWCVKPNLLEQ